MNITLEEAMDAICINSPQFPRCSKVVNDKGELLFDIIREGVHGHEIACTPCERLWLRFHSEHKE